MLRSPCDEEIRPKSPLPKKTCGEFRILVFVRFRNSDLNSSLRLSLKGNSFLMPISKFLRPGPRNLPLLHWPNVAAGAAVKLLGSNHWMPRPETGVLG